MTIIKYLPESLTQRLTWHTDVLKAVSGLEHRHCLQQVPTIGVEVAYALAGDAAAAAIRSLRELQFADPGAEIEIPCRHEGVAPASDITTTSAVVGQANTLDWAIVDRRVYIEQDEDEAGYGATITAVSAPSGGNVTLTLNASPPSTYTAARTRVSPLVTVQPDDQAGLGQYRVTGGGWVLTATQTAFEPQGLATALLTSFDSKYVLNHRPAQGADQLSEDFDTGLEVVGEGGPFEATTLRTYADIRRAHSFTADSLVEWLLWKAFLFNVYGQQVAFLMPTWRPDLIVNTQPTAGNSFILVENTPDYTPWFAATSHRWLQLTLADNSVEYAKATSLTPGASLRINLSSALTLAGGTVSKISFLELCRLASDDVTITHMTGGLLSLGLQIVVVQQ